MTLKPGSAPAGGASAATLEALQGFLGRRRGAADARGGAEVSCAHDGMRGRGNIGPARRGMDMSATDVFIGADGGKLAADPQEKIHGGP